MRSVGVRELKDNLSEYLRVVAEGETVLVTLRDRVVASLGPPPRFHHAGNESGDEALDRLALSGILRRGRGRPASAGAEALPVPSEPVDLQRLLDESRDERA
ncbi:MAG: prevent-host-death protein [Pseudomonadota bacterium]|nr:prevent-host-death protein [Pseudomonadota bacterium]